MISIVNKIPAIPGCCVERRFMEVILMDSQWKCGYWSVVTGHQAAGHSHREFISKSPEIFSGAKNDSKPSDLTLSDFYLSECHRVPERRNSCNNSLTNQ